QLLAEGFPWQASVGIDQGSVESVKEGTEVEVNGQKLRGPGTVFRKSTLREASFVALGADPKTSAEAFAANSDADAVIAAFTFDPKEAQMATEPKTETAPATTPPTAPAAPAAPAPAVTAAAPPAAPAGAQMVTLSAQEIEALVDRKVKVLADTRRTREAKLRPLAFANQEQLLQ